jgi:hypothetical protein
MGSPVIGSQSARRGRPRRVRIRLTVRAGTPVTAAISSRPVRSSRRAASTRRSTRAGVRPGQLRGREDRVLQAGLALGPVPPHPLVGALPGDAHLLRDMRDRALVTNDALNQQQATMNGQASVNVCHRGLRLW